VFALSPLAVDEPLVQDYKLLALPGRVLATQREPRAHASKILIADYSRLPR
jgi:hypothetical protein